MPREDAIRVEGRVVEPLSDTLSRVELPNGHRIQAFAKSWVRAGIGPLKAGDRVLLEMTPFDLSEGSITKKLD